MIRKLLIPVLLLATLPLTACESSRQALGLERSSPDEFAVLTRAPLEIPRSYGLRPPRPGEARPQEFSPTEQARQALLPKTGTAAAPVGISDAEQAFLQRSKASEVTPSIRQLVDEENAQLVRVESTLIKDLIQGDGERSLYPVVDPVAEVERLKRNKRDGLPVNDGDVPEIAPPQPGFLP